MIQKIKSNTKLCLGCDSLFIPHGGENCCSRDCALKANLAILSTENSHLNLTEKIHRKPNIVIKIGDIDFTFYEFEKKINSNYWNSFTNRPENYNPFL